MVFHLKKIRKREGDNVGGAGREIKRFGRGSFAED